MIFDTPSIYVLIGIIVYILAYYYYVGYIEKKIWSPDPKRPTPAKMYFDGVEYFPISKYVLFGYQFKSIAALGPIVGPMVATHFYGWLPAILWILLGNFFIGWVQDYSTLLMSVRKEGRSLGPITYELLGGRARSILLVYIIFYLIILAAVFAWTVVTLLNGIPGSIIPTLVVLITGYIFGLLVFRMRLNVYLASLIALIIVFVGYALVPIFPQLKIPSTNFLDPGLKGTQPGSLTALFWLIVIGIIYYLASVTPMIRWLLPTVYVAYLPSIVALILIVLGALATFATGVTIDPSRKPVVGWAYFDPIKYPTIGPLWPMLFVTIACGAISGWHSIISGGLSSKQLEYETDARPVAAGAMFTEGVLALSSVAAVMVIATPAAPTALDYPNGASKIVYALLPFISKEAWLYFYTVFVIIMGLITSMLFARVFRIVAGEIFPRPFGHYLISPIIYILIMIFLAWPGSWTNLWLYFGGTNQLMAGLALMLVSVYLINQKKPSWYAFWPGIFMLVTTLGAVFWETYVYLAHVLQGKFLPPQAAVVDRYGFGFVNASNIVSAAFGAILFILGLLMTYYLFKGYLTYRKQIK
ncbi:MAG: carbon starvation CstA family protein [Sulfolobales archaeon]